MDQNNREIISFEVGNFLFDISVKTPCYIQSNEFEKNFKEEIFPILYKNLKSLNKRFYADHSITKKADKLEHQKQNQLQNNLDTNMPNEQTTPPLYNRELIKNNDPIIKSENPNSKSIEAAHHCIISFSRFKRFYTGVKYNTKTGKYK